MNSFVINNLIIYLIGMVLGKAIYENITLSAQFSHFFLSFFNGKYNFLYLIEDLNIYDSELYKNLMFLKTYENDISELDLTFSITDNNYGTINEIELFPGGSKQIVTSTNR